MGLLDTEAAQSTREAKLLSDRDRLDAMSIVMTQRCLSAEPWFQVFVPSATDPDTTYRVLVPWPDDEMDDLTCECMSFIHRGHCHHQKEAFESLCRWTSTEGPEKQTREQRRNHICPRCGGETKGEAEFT